MIFPFHTGQHTYSSKSSLFRLIPRLKLLHLRTLLLTLWLASFNGTNPKSVVVLDNCYSPDLSPIEEGFSKLKSVLKANETSLDYLDTQTVVLAAINSTATQDCSQWIMHAGYT